MPPTLITCPACQRQVSTNADRCPHCGEPIKRGFLGKSGFERTANVIVLAVLIVSFLYGCSHVI